MRETAQMARDLLVSDFPLRGLGYVICGCASHLEGREPRLHRLQEVGQEVDGARHACKKRGRGLTFLYNR